jgi:enamine deaminase RidA (YjgF/YER057c/UK114 family)
MMRRAVLGLACSLAAGAGALGKKKKKKEEETQTLPLLKELPQALTADARRLVFHVTPLSGKGLLSQQIRDALKAIHRASGGAPVVKLRAFVAGTGDLRRVRDLVSATFTERREPLPVLSLVQAGGLPMTGAQIAFEAVTEARKPVNPHGLAFHSAQAAYDADPLAPVEPLAAQAGARLREALRAAGAGASGVVKLTCFLSSFERLDAVRGPLLAEYPSAAVLFVQARRAPDRAMAALEAVARLAQAPARPVEFVRPDPAAGESLAVRIGAAQLVLTGTQVAFGYQENDARLAFGRLARSLEQAGTRIGRTVFAHYYPLSPGIETQVRKLRREIFASGDPPASTIMPLEGLPSIEAGFAVDVVAVKQ